MTNHTAVDAIYLVVILYASTTTAMTLFQLFMDCTRLRYLNKIEKQSLEKGNQETLEKSLFIRKQISEKWAWNRRISFPLLVSLAEDKSATSPEKKEVKADSPPANLVRYTYTWEDHKKNIQEQGIFSENLSVRSAQKGETE